MLNILRDPIWQTVLGVVAIVISVIAIRFQQGVKEISCKILSIAPLFDIKDDIQGKLKFLFDDKPIKDAFLIVFKIINSGKIPITVEDQKRGIAVNIPAEKILTADIIEKHPHDIDASITTQNCLITLEPTLLNPGESVTIKTVAVSFSGNITTSARIVGVNQIETIAPNSDLQIRWLKNYKRVFAGVVVGLIGVSSLILASRTFTAPPEVTITRGDTILETSEDMLTIPVNNCSGTTDVTTRTSRKGLDVVAYIGGKKIENTNGNFEFTELGSLSIGQRIAETYGLAYGESLGKASDFEFNTPAGSYMIYTIQFRYRFGTGEVTIYQPSKNRVYSYAYKILIDNTADLFAGEQRACP